MQPTANQRETLVEHWGIYRQAYNHFLYRLNQHDGTPEMTTLRDELPSLKKWWDDLPTCIPVRCRRLSNGCTTTLRV